MPPSARISGRGGTADSLPLASLSVARQDLSSDKLLLAAPRVAHADGDIPTLGGTPLLAKLGQGGMGAVYFGFHPRLHKEVAVKVLPFHLAEQQPELIDRFYREAQIAARVQSPHLVGVLDVNQDSGLFYIVMEFVRGISAGSHLKEIRKAGVVGLDEATVLDICIAAAEGLAAAHAEGIIHRDIKPDNILIPRASQSGELIYTAAKLADLGLAHVDVLGQSVTKSDAAMGTPGYMPPEQGMSAKRAGKPADVFALGATVYTLLGGRAPFQGESSMQILLHTMQQPHTPLQQLLPGVSAATAALVDRCLAKEPQGRYVDASALLEALKVCRAALGEADVTQQHAIEQMTLLQRAAEVGKPVAADSSPPPVHPSAVAGAERIATPLPPAAAVQPAARSRTLTALVALLMLGLLAGGGYGAWQWREREFHEVRGSTVDAARPALTADSSDVARSIALLEDFKRAHASRGPSDLAPVTELLLQLEGRRDRLTKRKADFEAAISEYNQMLEMGKQLNSPDLIAKALGCLAAAYYERRKFDEGLRCARDMKELAQAYRLDSWLAYSCFMLGNVLLQTGQNEQCLREYTTALRVAWPLLDEHVIAGSLQFVGDAMSRLGRGH
ncbi:MAG: serine/threonine-protein kinase, partial [Planctomycetota bacterium]|nr:serine/threonine-protein kinase [Planctomycetota bacterium]